VVRVVEKSANEENEDDDDATDSIGQASSGFALVALAIALVDAPIDVAFIIHIAPGPAGENHEITNDFYAALCTLLLAIAANFLILCHFLKKEASSNPAFGPWLWRHHTTIVPVLFLAMFKFDCMALLYTRFLGRPAFSAPLSIKSQQKLVWLGVVGTVLEGFPQLLITVDVHQHQQQDRPKFLVLATLVLNSCSLLYALLTRLVAGVVYSSHNHDKKEVSIARSKCPRLCPRVVSAAMLAVVMLTGAAVVVLLLRHHDPPFVKCFGLADKECRAWHTVYDSMFAHAVLSSQKCKQPRADPCACNDKPNAYVQCINK
jgi:hypothetical protein